VWFFDFNEAVERWNSHGVEFPPDKLIEDIPVSERVRNTLAREGIHTLKQALCYEGNLQHLRNFGTKSYNELLAVLRDYLSLSQTSDESNTNNKNERKN
jgi:DNA-directed RNA polymerase alpha subunit